MGRRKIEIKKIDSKAQLHTSFTKRRHGLFKKADKLCGQGCSVAAIVISAAGNAFVYAHPDLDTVIDRYMQEANPVPAAAAPSDVVAGGEEPDEANGDQIIMEDVVAGGEDPDEANGDQIIMEDVVDVHGDHASAILPAPPLEMAEAAAALVEFAKKVAELKELAELEATLLELRDEAIRRRDLLDLQLAEKLGISLDLTLS